MKEDRVSSADNLFVSLAGWGAARADVASVAGLRKSIPAWAPKDTPGHFLKHADEQTVLAVAAIDQAICSSNVDPNDYRHWAIIAAPRFIGRFAGVATLDRYTRGGGPAISPHLIPQHSLHSISGALSVLLQSRQPNCGVGGTGNSLAEALLAAITFPAAGCKGVWLIATAWDPEPQFDPAGQCLNAPACHAIALALRTAAQAGDRGTLRLASAQQTIGLRHASTSSQNAAALCRSFAALVPGGAAGCFAWSLPWGSTIILEARAAASPLAAAA